MRIAVRLMGVQQRNETLAASRDPVAQTLERQFVIVERAATEAQIERRTGWTVVQLRFAAGAFDDVVAVVGGRVANVVGGPEAAVDGAEFATDGEAVEVEGFCVRRSRS